jgi:hypothetical protein
MPRIKSVSLVVCDKDSGIGDIPGTAGEIIAFVVLRLTILLRPAYIHLLTLSALMSNGPWAFI